MARQLNLTPAEREARDKAFNASRGVADRILREHHQDEWNGYYQKELADRGYTWEPKPDPETEALEQISNLLRQFPDLGEKLAAKLTQEA